MEQMEIVIELEAERASEFAAALRDKHVDIEGPDQIDSLDGVTLAAFIVTVTPIVAPYIIQLVQALKGSSGRIRHGNSTLNLENFSIEQLKAILGVTDESKSTTTS